VISHLSALICQLPSNSTESLQQDLVSLESEKNSEIEGLRASLTQKEQELAHQQTEADTRKGEEAAAQESAQAEKAAQELEGLLFLLFSCLLTQSSLIRCSFLRVQEKSQG